MTTFPSAAVSRACITPPGCASATAAAAAAAAGFLLPPAPPPPPPSPPARRGCPRGDSVPMASSASPPPVASAYAGSTRAGAAMGRDTMVSRVAPSGLRAMARRVASSAARCSVLVGRMADGPLSRRARALACSAESLGATVEREGREGMLPGADAPSNPAKLPTRLRRRAASNPLPPLPALSTVDANARRASSTASRGRMSAAISSMGSGLEATVRSNVTGGGDMSSCCSSAPLARSQIITQPAASVDTMCGATPGASWMATPSGGATCPRSTRGRSCGTRGPAPRPVAVAASRSATACIMPPSPAPVGAPPGADVGVPGSPAAPPPPLPPPPPSTPPAGGRRRTPLASTNAALRSRRISLQRSTHGSTSHSSTACTSAVLRPSFLSAVLPMDTSVLCRSLNAMHRTPNSCASTVVPAMGFHVRSSSTNMLPSAVPTTMASSANAEREMAACTAAGPTWTVRVRAREKVSYRYTRPVAAAKNAMARLACVCTMASAG